MKQRLPEIPNRDIKMVMGNKLKNVPDQKGGTGRKEKPA